jgi:hypothetical protein
VGKTICIDENQVALIKQLSNVMIPPSWLALFMPRPGFCNHAGFKVHSVPNDRLKV